MSRRPARPSYRRPARATRPASKGPAVTVRRRVPLAKRSSLTRLSRQVRYNTQQAQGRLQLSYQCIDWAGATSTHRGVTDVQNHYILVQGIQAGTPVYSPTEAAPGPPITLTVTKIGSWVECENPAVKLNSLYSKYDQLKYYSNALGVQPVYVHYSSDYCFNFFAKDCTGWLEVAMITYRKQTSYTSTAGDNYVLPGGTIGMINTCQGANDQTLVNPYLFKRKVLARKYFNTAAAGTAGHYLGTQPNLSLRLRVKNPKHMKMCRLRANELYDPTAATLPKTDWDTIDRNVQRWLQISSTIEDHANTADAGITYQGYRLNKHRDQLGSVS